MSKKEGVPITTHHVINVLDAKLAAQLGDYRMLLGARSAGFPVLTDWHPVIPEGWGEFQQVPCERALVYRGNADTWAYSHHQAITKLGERYVASWSNGFLHEDYVGQEVHYAWSTDGRQWSEPRVVSHTPVESRLVRSNSGLYARDGRLYCYVCVAKDFGRDVAPPGMSVLKEQHIRLDAYETEDLETWTHHEGIAPDIYLFEGPRETRGGKLMCIGSELLITRDRRGIVLIWDDPSRPADPPRAVGLSPSPEGVIPGQATWYQTDDGRIWLYERDSSISCRLGLTWSDDEGETWSDLLRTDFQNTYSRPFAGRLRDGRFYIVGNNYDKFLDRRHLLIALSDDGRAFDRQYTLVEGETTRRINGRHKEDGFHYPNCYADGDTLFVIYSVNKEDIEVLSVDMRQVD